MPGPALGRQVASIHCATRDLAAAPRHGRDRRRPARLGDRRRGGAAAVAGRQRPRRDAGDAAGVQAARPAVVRLRRVRQRDLAVRAGEQPTDPPRPDPPGRAPGLPGRGGPRVLRPRRRQRAQPRAGDAVELRVRLAPAGGLDDHHAGRQERLPLRPRARRPLQAAAGPLRADARAPVHQGPDPRALPEHRLLRQQRLRDPGRRRDVLRHDGRPAQLHPGRLPRRARAGAVDLRPRHQPRAQPGPIHPGARAPRRRHVHHRDPVRRPGCQLRAARPRAHDARALLHPHLLHRGAARLPAEPLDDPRCHLRRALQQPVPRRPADPHQLQPAQPVAGRAGPQRAPRHQAGLRRGTRLARHEDRGDPGDGRRQGLRGRRARGEHGAAAPADGLQHQVLRAGGGAAGGRPARRHHRRRQRLLVPGPRPTRTSSSRTP